MGFRHFLLIACTLSMAAAAAESPAGDTTSTTILIAQGGTGFEYAVIEALRERIAAEWGMGVQVVALRELGRFEREGYAAVILMNAVHGGELSRTTARVVDRLRARRDREDKPVVFISTVRGDEWREGSTLVDATTRATNRADALRVAENLHRNLARHLRGGGKSSPDTVAPHGDTIAVETHD